MHADGEQSIQQMVTLSLTMELLMVTLSCKLLYGV